MNTPLSIYPIERSCCSLKRKRAAPEFEQRQGQQRKQWDETPVGAVSAFAEPGSFIVARADDAGVPTAIKLAKLIQVAWISFGTTNELRGLERLCVYRPIPSGQSYGKSRQRIR